MKILEKLHLNVCLPAWRAGRRHFQGPVPPGGTHLKKSSLQ